MRDIRAQFRHRAAVCFMSQTRKTKLFAFLVHNFVDDGSQIRLKPGGPGLLQDCLYFMQ